MTLPRAAQSIALPIAIFSSLSLVSAQHAPEENPPSLLPTREARDVPQPDEEGRFFSVPSVEWELHKTEDGAHPDGNEQAMVWLMNRARSDPEAEGVFLADSGDADVENAMNQFGVDVELMKTEFAAIPRRQPAAFDRRIYLGSEVHSLALIASDDQNHDFQFDRVEDAGFVHNGASASVYSYASGAVHAHAAFNVDWGGNTADGMQEGRGHRQGLMNSGGLPYTNVGIAMVPEGDANTNVGPLVTSIVYARALNVADHFNLFLVGTVWTDANDNGLYDNCEGLAGVTVTPDIGTCFATTGDAGGYAIPVAENGTYTLTFEGGELLAPEVRVATVDGESALVVWNAADSYNAVDPTPPPPPILQLEHREDGLLVSWMALGGILYSLQRYDTEEDVWIEDDRTIASEGSTQSFVIGLQELEIESLFRIAVTEIPLVNSSN